MPTLVYADSFSHQKNAIRTGTSGFNAPWDDVTQGTTWTFDTTVKRTANHLLSLKMVQNSSFNALRRATSGSPTVVVQSFYFRVTAAPSAQSGMAYITASNPASERVEMDTSGYIVTSGGGTSTNTYADSNWHLMDIKYNVAANPHTINVTIDGTDTVSGSQALAAGTITYFNLGTSNNSDTLTCWYSDYVVSYTSGDYPMGEHAVIPIFPDGDGTHNLNGHITDAGAGTTNLYQSVDDLSGGGAPDTATYLTQTTTGTTDYAEMTLSASTSMSSFWGVAGWIGGFASSASATTPLTGFTSVRDSGGTEIDTIDNAIDYSNSTSVVDFYFKMLAAPGGGWSNSTLDGCKLRWGGHSIFSSRQPRLSAAWLDVVGVTSNPDANATPSTVGAVAAVPAPTISLLTNPTPSAVGAVVAVPTPDIYAEGPADAYPDTVAAVAAVPAPTISADAVLTMTAVGAVAAVPAPTITVDVNFTPDAVAAVAALPAPTIDTISNYTATVTDSLGATDTANRAVTYNRTYTDHVTESDTVSQAHSKPAVRRKSRGRGKQATSIPPRRRTLGGGR